MAQRDDWDFASLALSVNMIGARFSLDAFSRRVSYMVDKLAGADPGRPVFCITIYPHFRDAGVKDPVKSPACGTAEAYREKLREAVQACGHANAHLVEGPDILRDWTGLSPDLIHPSDAGMAQMAEHLAARMEPYLK